jgi:hypothetical protein
MVPGMQSLLVIKLIHVVNLNKLEIKFNKQDAHIESQNRIVQNNSPRNDAMEIAIMDPVVDLERCSDDDIQSLLHNDTIQHLPITHRDNNIIQTRVNIVLLLKTNATI